MAKLTLGIRVRSVVVLPKRYVLPGRNQRQRPVRVSHGISCMTFGSYHPGHHRSPRSTYFTIIVCKMMALVVSRRLTYDVDTVANLYLDKPHFILLRTRSIDASPRDVHFPQLP